MSVAIVDYGSGNLHSAAKAFERAARSMDAPERIVVTRDPESVYRADRIVLPGVGAFADCRRGLDELDGMIEAMTEAVRNKARPFFGICVGMQLMATRGKEHVTTDGFNWIAGDVEKISPREKNLKIPHMGWNTLDMIREHPVLERLPLGPNGRHAYFVHSYHLNAANEADVLARADYGGPVTAIVGKDTAVGTQFHPEKSQRFELFEMEAVMNAFAPSLVTSPLEGEQKAASSRRLEERQGEASAMREAFGKGVNDKHRTRGYPSPQPSPARGKRAGGGP